MTGNESKYREIHDGTLRRRAHLAQSYREALAPAPRIALAGVAGGPRPVVTIETIVRRDRPVFFLANDRLDETHVGPLDGAEAKELFTELKNAMGGIQPFLPLVGRVDVDRFPGSADYLGTGWFIESDIVVTNRHVAEHLARWDGTEFRFTLGTDGKPIGVDLRTTREYVSEAIDPRRSFVVERLLWIAPPASPHDVAFLKVRRHADGTHPGRIELADADAALDAFACVVGYPAKAERDAIPDQALMERMFGGRYRVKRIAPGHILKALEGGTRHDCTTLGGNSGSVVLDPISGKALGLHYAGRYELDNFAVPVSVLRDLRDRRVWERPYEVETSPAAPAVIGSQPQATAPGGIDIAVPGQVSGPVTISIPISVTIGAAGGAPAMSAGGAGGGERATLVEACRTLRRSDIPGVVAVRPGFLDDGDRIGDTPCVAVSARPSAFAAVVARLGASWMGHPLRIDPASVAEQIAVEPLAESTMVIAYDDGARQSSDFSFEIEPHEMSVVAHVGPEYSWDQLQAFIKGAKERLVSGIYEFHGTAIKDAIENRLSAVENPLEFDLVMAAQTVKKPRPDKLAAGVEFDREKVFEAWDEDFDNRFRAIIAPVGAKGLVRMSYHIKVSVADDDAVWLSSGNWKQESSQPVVTQAMRDAAGSQDVPGNREWHVILTSKPLADFFRAHLLQDAKRSKHLQGEIVAEDALAGIMVEAPAVVPIVVERPPPRKVLPPLTINGRVSVRPLLTPDRRGAVYSEAVLDLIASARHQLLFQIPYIDPPTDPDKDRGYIDELFEALTRKMRRLPDARIILRGDSSEKYDPANAAWAFKHAGVATADRVKAMDRHHTKGMVVDGRRVLIGSHNWSGLGVSLNRDASLIFDDERIARYYAEAFEIDWARASTVRPKRFVKKVSEGVGGSPAYERVRLGDMWSEDD